MKGQIDILNCGTGHSEVKVDTSDPIALARSERIIQDMLRRGYVLFITGKDNELIRVEKFNAENHTYIIGDLGEPPRISEPEPERRNPLCGEVVPSPGKPARGRPKKGTKEIPIGDAHVTAIARTAGG